MLQETLRCLQKTEVDLAVDAEAVKHHVSMAIAEFDRLPGRCTRCWGKGVMKVRCREAVGALVRCAGAGADAVGRAFPPSLSLSRARVFE